MDRWKAEQGRGREKRKIRRKKSRRETVRRKKMQMREKVGKSRNTVFSQWFGAPEGRKVGSLKRRVRSQLARWEMKSCTPLWREAHLEVKMHKTHQGRTTFGSCDVEKVHALVAQSTLRSQNAQNTPAPDHFWKLRCRKSARRCREAHFQVKMYKTHHCRTTFGSWDVEKVHAVVAQSTFRSENVQNTRGSDHFWRFRCRFARSLHYTTLRYIAPHSTILHYITLHYTPQHYNYNYTTRLHSTTLHYIKFHYTTLRSTTLHYTTLNHTTLHYITLHYTTLNFTTLHYTTLRSTTLHYIKLHYTTLHYTTTTTTNTQLHSTTLHYTTLHSTTLHYTTLHYTTLQYTEWHCTTDRQVDR